MVSSSRPTIASVRVHSASGPVTTRAVPQRVVTLLGQFLSTRRLEGADHVDLQQFLGSLRKYDGTQFGTPDLHLQIDYAPPFVNGPVDFAPAIAGITRRHLTLREIPTTPAGAPGGSSPGSQTSAPRRSVPRPAEDGVYSFHRAVKLADSSEYNGKGDDDDRDDETEKLVADTMAHLLKSVCYHAGLHVISDSEAHGNWEANLAREFQRFRFTSGELLSDSLFRLEALDNENLLLHLKENRAKFGSSEIVHALVYGIVDEHTGLQLTIHGTKVRTIVARDNVRRSGWEKTSGPYLCLGTVTVDPEDPERVCLRRAVLLPIVSRTCICPVDSDNERRVVQVFRDHGETHWLAGARLSRVLFPVIFSPTDSCHPDLLLEFGDNRTYCEVLGFGDDVYLGKKLRHADLIRRYAKHEPIDAFRKKHATLARRVHEILSAVA